MHEVLRESRLVSEQIVIISFRKEVIREHKKLMPEVKACWIRHFRKSRKTGLLEPDLAWVINVIRDVDADGLSMNQLYVEEVLKAGLRVHNCWTVNEASRAMEISKTACDSISSNYPDVLLNSFEAEVTDS